MVNQVNGLAFVGPIGSGKTTMVEAMLKQIPNSEPAPFALALKEEVAAACAVDDSDRRRILKEMHDPEMKRRWRTVLQWWGTELRRDQYSEDYWVEIAHDVMADTIARGAIVLNDDCRFENEHKLLTTLGFKFIRCLPNWDAMRTTTFDQASHRSEELWKKIDVDLVIPWKPTNERVWDVMNLYKAWQSMGDLVVTA